VVSHEIALDLHDLSDVIPERCTSPSPPLPPLPTGAPGVKILAIERPLRPGDRIIRGGVAITSAIRTGLDAAEAGTAPEQIEPTGAQAVERHGASGRTAVGHG
jgi:hypothetical protein